MISRKKLLIIGVVLVAFTGTVGVVFDTNGSTDVETNANNANGVNLDNDNRGGELASNNSTTTTTPDNPPSQSSSINHRYGVSLERGFLKDTSVTLGGNGMAINQTATETKRQSLNRSTFRTTIQNDLDIQQPIRIVVEFQQPDGTPIRSVNNSMRVGPGETVTIEFDYNATTDEVTVTEHN